MDDAVFWKDEIFHYSAFFMFIKSTKPNLKEVFKNDNLLTSLWGDFLRKTYLPLSTRFSLKKFRVMMNVCYFKESKPETKERFLEFSEVAFIYYKMNYKKELTDDKKEKEEKEDVLKIIKYYSEESTDRVNWEISIGQCENDYTAFREKFIKNYIEIAPLFDKYISKVLLMAPVYQYYY